MWPSYGRVITDIVGYVIGRGLEYCIFAPNTINYHDSKHTRSIN